MPSDRELADAIAEAIRNDRETDRADQALTPFERISKGFAEIDAQREREIEERDAA